MDVHKVRTRQRSVPANRPAWAGAVVCVLVLFVLAVALAAIAREARASDDEHIVLIVVPKARPICRPPAPIHPCCRS